MQAIGSVSALCAGMVHPKAQGPLEQLRHRDFIASKLAFVALALAGAPIFVALRGVPSPGEAAIFVLALAQLIAALIVGRCGRLALGSDVAVLGLVGIGVAACCLPAVNPLSAGSWFIAAAADAAIASRARRIVPLLIGAACMAALLLPAPFDPGRGMALLALAAVVPMLSTAWRARRSVASAAAAARAAEGRRGILDEIGGVAIVDLDLSGLVTRISASSAAHLGANPEALQGRGLFEHIQVADRPQFLKLVSDAAHGSGGHAGVLRLRRAAPDSTASAPHHLRVEMRVVGDPAGGAVVASFRDVTDAHDAEVARAEAHAIVAEALRSRDEFLANISHELRTPLNAVIGFSEMLASQTLRPSDADKQRDYARIIHQSGLHLLSVVSAILDMSKIQSGTFSLSPERFDVGELVEQCFEMMQLKADAGRVALFKDVPGDLPLLCADRRACRQILINLLANAVKFTPGDGEVLISVRADGTALRVIVRDTGIGVAAADLGKLGQPFFQVDGTLCRSFEGTGLGLSVVRGLVGLHDGELEIASEVGRGTSITVRLPVAGPAPPRMVSVDAVAVMAEPSSHNRFVVEAQAADVARFPDRRHSIGSSRPIDSRMTRRA